MIFVDIQYWIIWITTIIYKNTVTFKKGMNITSDRILEWLLNNFYSVEKKHMVYVLENDSKTIQHGQVFCTRILRGNCYSESRKLNYDVASASSILWDNIVLDVAVWWDMSLYINMNSIRCVSHSAKNSLEFGPNAHRTAGLI